MTPTKQSRAPRARASSWLFSLQIAAFLTILIALLLAAWGLWERVGGHSATLAEIEKAELARGWTLLTTPAPGNSGKVEAIEYLASKRQPLDGIDLSCETIGGIETNAQGEAVCVDAPYLNSIDLSKATLGRRVSLKGANLSGASLERADLSGAHLTNADFNNAQGTETADFTGAWAWADTPPLNLSVEIDLRVYKDSLERFTTERPDPCIAPNW